MDTRNEIREFLTSRRARISPTQVGLPGPVGRRRVAGLRREEVALLAGVSVDYYTRLERGSLKGVSEGVLEALARALELDDAERTHLFNLARAENARPRARRSPAQAPIRAALQQILDAMPLAPAYVRNSRLDVLATNALGRALLPHVFDDPTRVPNLARSQFLDPRAQEFFIEYEKMTNDCVALLRAAAGRDPHDKPLSDLIGELSMRSADFRVKWAAHNVRQNRSGRKLFRHPSVGELTLDYEALHLSTDDDLTMLVYTAPAGSPSYERLQLLASLAATTAALGG